MPHQNHPLTLLGAARMILMPDESPQALRLKVVAASRLGYHAQAREIWSRLALAGEAEATVQLQMLAQTHAHVDGTSSQMC